jgi:hypothetical protein
MAEAASTRIRSPSYPCIDLETAINRTESLYDYGKRSQVLISAMLPQWGFSETSANGMKVVAALKSFGLIDDAGQKENRKIAITARAYRILKDHPESEERLQAIKDAALDPDIYSYCWKEFGELSDMPHDDAVRSHLIFEKKFNETAVRGFLADYKKSIQFANLSKNDTLDVDHEDDSDDIDDERNEDQTDEHEEYQHVKHNKPPTSTRPGMQQSTHSLKEGEVIFQMPKEISEGSGEELETFMELIKMKIKRSIIKDENKDDANISD